MTDTRKGALRSFGRSLLFALVPVVVVFATDAEWLKSVTGFSTEYAALVAAVVGAVLRSVLPNTLGSRAAAQ